MPIAASFAGNCHIRVFISSTFQYMGGERSHLKNRTFPRLRDISSRRGVMLSELDLHWGITYEESKSGRVVNICFREIDNSVPFFIGIIYNRYGWIPEAKDIGDGVIERFPSVLQYLDSHLEDAVKASTYPSSSYSSMEDLGSYVLGIVTSGPDYGR